MVKTVAVCMGTYNAANYLSEMLTSLEKQTYKDFSVYIFNDGSTDNTKEVIKGFKKKLDIKVKNSKGIHNIGTVKNKIVKVALKNNHKYIQMVDHDDVLEPVFLEKMVTKIEEGNDFVVCNGITFGDTFFSLRNEETNKKKIEELNPFLSWIMMRRETALKHNYREGMAHYEDWDLHISLIRGNQKYGIVRELLYNYRMHGNQFHKITERNRGEHIEYLQRINGIIDGSPVPVEIKDEPKEDEILGIKEELGKSWWDLNFSDPKFRSWLGQEDTPSRIKVYEAARKYESVLDCACGTCLDYMKYKKEGFNIKYKGIDNCQGLVDEAVAKGIDAELGDIEDMRFKDNSFDIVTARHILEHLPGYKKALTEMCRVAKHEVVIVFFKPPSDNEKIGTDPNLKGQVNLNTYSKAKIEETAKKYGEISWETVGSELILKIKK